MLTELGGIGNQFLQAFTSICLCAQIYKLQNDESFPCGGVLAFQSQHPKKYTDVYAAGEQSFLFFFPLPILVMTF